MRPSRWALAAWAAVLFAGFAALYLGIAPSLAYQHWDSLEYAYSCETRGPLATWGNHPLGQLLQCGVYEIARAAGRSGRALPVLAWTSGVTSAAAVAAFFVLMIRGLRVTIARALGWSLLLGGGYSVWHYAGTADIYCISLFFLVLAWDRIITPPDTPSRSSTALTIAAIVTASLIHQYNVVMIAAGMLGLAMFRAGDRRRLLGLAIWSGAIATVGYAILGVYSLPSRSALRVYRWIIGYGGDPTYGHSFGLRGVLPGLHSIAETFLRDPYFPGPRVLWGAVALAGVLLFLVGALRLRRLAAGDRAIVAACALQLAIGWALIIWWWPLMAGKWWILTLPFLIIWWDRALEGVISRAGRAVQLAANALPVLVGVFALVFNFVVALDVERQPDRAFEEGLAHWVQQSAPEDLLIENGRLTAHLIFWSGRPNAMNVYRVLQAGARDGDALAAVQRVIDTAIGDGHQVLFTSSLDPYFFTDELLSLVGVTRRRLEACFDQYRHVGPVFSYHEWPGSPPTAVYHLQRPDGAR